MMNSLMQSFFSDGFIAENSFIPEVFRLISFKNGFHYKMHSHKRIEINYILRGSCVMMFGKQLVKLKQNNSVIIMPGTKHDFFVDSKQGVKMVQLEFVIDEKIFVGLHKDAESDLSFLSNLKTNTAHWFKIPNNPEIGSCIERIIRENKFKQKNYDPLSSTLRL